MEEIKTDERALCPVMAGIPVDKDSAVKEGRMREYQNEKYYFCCDPCITEFEINPEIYAR